MSLLRAPARPRTLSFSLTGWLRSVLSQRLSGLRHGSVLIRDSSGEWRIGADSGPTYRIVIHDLAAYWHIVLGGSNGAAAAYRDALWETDDLIGLLSFVVRNRASMDALESGWARVGNQWWLWRHRSRANSRRGARRNIEAHYDLSNDLFALFLDPSMTYSAAVFDTPTTDLHSASIAKLDRICRKLDLRPGQHVLEIGSGWGSFALHAATHYGCEVTTTTLSKQQYRWAERRIAEAGLSERIHLLDRDYRDLDGCFDKVVSIEMIEAVGHRFLPTYFETCSRLLADDGQLLIQAITLADQHHARYLRNTDFIQQMIFPGGCLPSISSIMDAVREHTDLRLSDLEDIASHYARTLECWRENFLANKSKVKALGYDSAFIRLWTYYLSYCQAGLGERYLGTVQMVFDKPTWRGETRRTYDDRAALS